MVMQRETHAEPVAVELTPPEGYQLRRFLEQLQDRSEDAAAAASLATIEEGIGDAMATARWLRENVQLELSSAEILELVKALSQGLDCESVDDRLALAAIRNKLLVAQSG